MPSMRLHSIEIMQHLSAAVLLSVMNGPIQILIRGGSGLCRE